MAKINNNVNLTFNFNKVFSFEEGFFVDKYIAHHTGKKHLAFSLFLFDDKANLLLQKRANGKIFPNLWTNTCCSHPIFKKNSSLQVNTRLFQEFGFHIEKKDIYKILSLHYIATCKDTNFTENEVDDVYVGFYKKDKSLILSENINKNEIAEFEWVNFEQIILEVKKNDNLEKKYTPWFLKIIRDNHSDLMKVVKQKLF